MHQHLLSVVTFDVFYLGLGGGALDGRECFTSHVTMLHNIKVYMKYVSTCMRLALQSFMNMSDGARASVYCNL